MKDVFVFYRSYHEAMKDFSDAQYGKLMRALAEYALNEKEPEKLERLAAMVFTLIKPQIDAMAKSYETGKRGGRPKKETGVLENKKRGFLKNENGGFSETETGVIENQKPINDIPSINPSINTSININPSTSINSSAVADRLNQFFENVEILKNHPLTFDERNRITQKLVILGKTEGEQLKIINQAIDRGWKDLYPLKKKDVDWDEFIKYYAEENNAC